MSAHERLERAMAIEAGRAWLAASPRAAMPTERVARAAFYDGPLLGGAATDDILIALREPDNPHDANAIAWWSELAQVGHVPAELAEALAPRMDDRLALWARVFQEATTDHPGTMLVEMFGPAMEGGNAGGDVTETEWGSDTDIPF